MEKSLTALLQRSIFTPKRERLAHIEETVDSVVRGCEQFATGEMLLSESDGDPTVKRRRMKFGYNLPEFPLHNLEGTAFSQGEGGVDLRNQLTLIAQELMAAVVRSQQNRENDNEREEVIDLNKPILAELYASPLNKENVAFQVVADRRPDNNEYGSGTGTAADPICLEETIMDGLQASFSDGENLPVNTTTERKPSQEEVQPRPMQNKPDSELGSEKCVDLHVSRPIYKWPIIVEKQVLLQTEACKSSEIDNENEVLAKSASGLSKSTQHFGTEPGSLEEPSVIESLRYIGKGAQIASGDGYGSQLLDQSGESGAKCSRSGLVLAEKKRPINGPNLPYGAPVMTKVVSKFGRRRF